MYQIGWYYKDGRHFHDEYTYHDKAEAMLGMCSAGMESCVKDAYVMDAETGEILAELKLWPR